MIVGDHSFYAALQVSRKKPACFWVIVPIIMTCASLAQSVTIVEGGFDSFAYIGVNSTSNDEPTKVAVTDANVILVGGISSPVQRGGESDLGEALVGGLREEDFFVSKINATSGEVDWTCRGGTSKEDRLQAMLLDNSGRYLYVGGWTFGEFPKTSKSGQADIFVIKYDVSGDKPVEMWPTPLVLGTSASESVSSFTQDPNDEDQIYATGFTTGNLFPGKEAETSVFSDGILFSFSASSGTVIHARQFGTKFTDYGTDIVIPANRNGPIFVSVVTERKIGQYAFGNFHMYKFKRDGTPLGDLLLTTYSREQVTAFRQHPMLPGTLLSSGSSWLDSRNGYDVFLKRVVSPFDESIIGSQEIDIADVTKEEYTARVRSADGGHDYATGMIVDPDSGRVILSGYTGGAFAPGAKKKGVLAPYVASLNPLDASLTDAVQLMLPTENSWEEIACIGLAPGRRGLYYAAKQSNEATNQFHIAIGSFGFPATWKNRITIAPSPDPTPSPKTDNAKNNAERPKKEFPLMIVVGSVGGAVLLFMIIVAIVIARRVSKRGRAAKVYDPHKKQTQKQVQPQAPRAQPVVPQGMAVVGNNASGLV